MSGEWLSQAYLDVLRPAPGSEVTAALLASYSADLVSIAAALLALAGRDNDEGSGSKADLAEAVEFLRGKVRILIQRGRLARPKRIPGLAGILDQFIREIDFDENEKSWHPKLALVRFSGGEARDTWRLWVGSRNLTTTVNRDFGVLLHGAAESKASDATPIIGVGDVGARLASLARLDAVRPSKIRQTLDAVRWVHPEKLRIERLQLKVGDKPGVGLPEVGDVDEVIAVSPFLDGTTVQEIGRWGGPKTRRFLLSTQAELVKIAGQVAKPLAGFKDNIFILDSAVPEPVEPSEEPLDASDLSEGELELEHQPIGLHAKILAVRKGKAVRLWAGSANATQRAWRGNNAEVIVEAVTNPQVLDGLRSLLHAARPVSAADLEKFPLPDEQAAVERLENARKHFVGDWRGRLERNGDAFVLSCEKPPHPFDEAIALEAGLATASLQAWPRGQSALVLGTFPAGLQTQLVQVRLTLGELSCGWLQCMDVEPPLDEDRDRHAIVRHLGMSAFLAWIAALLGDHGFFDEGGTWDSSTMPKSSQPGNNFDPGLLTLDAMLACWARDRTNFQRISDRMKKYLGPLMAEASKMSAEEIKQLQGFQSVWAVVSSELLKKR